MDMEKRVTNRLIKKLRGFQKADKGRFLLVAFGELTQEELMLYEFCIAITDWDRDHVDTFGTFQATNQEIAEMLGWKADSTVSRHKKTLISKRYLIPMRDRYAVKDFDKWELRKTSFARMQTDHAKMQPNSAKMQGYSANMQGFQDQNTNYSLGSYKGNVRVVDQEVITDEELDRIADEIDKKMEEEKNRGGTPR